MAVYYDKEKKTYYCKFRYTNWQGIVKMTTKRGFKSKKAAHEYEMDAKRQIKKPQQLTLKELIEEKKASDKKRIKATSYDSFNRCYETHIIPFLGEKKIDEITPIDIRKWQDSLPATLRPSSVASYNTIFSMLMKYAVRYHGLKQNPFDVAGRTGKKTKREAFLEVDEFKKLIEATPYPLHRMAFNLLFWSGMRIGELLALTWQDVDFDEKVIHITKTVSRFGDVTRPKTDTSIRDITMPGFVMDELLESKKHNPTNKVMPITGSTLRYALDVNLKRAGLKHINIHGLRHSHASYLIKEGNISIIGISRRLGHANSQITLSTYSHVYQDTDRGIAEMIEKIEKSGQKVVTDKKEPPQTQ